MITASDKATHEPRFVVLHPSADKRAEIEMALACGGAVVETLMEVLDLDDSGRALLWVSDPNGARRSRLKSAVLPPAHQAEIIAAHALGYRAWLTLQYTVLGPHRSGGVAAIVERADGELSFVPAPAEPDLAELLG